VSLFRAVMTLAAIVVALFIVGLVRRRIEERKRPAARRRSASARR
jgi:hypothetical protein